MKIEIENFNNISKLIYEIDDNKINFLFGISGSGKSSIANCLSRSLNETNVKIGKVIGDVKILVDDKNCDYSNFYTFNQEYLDNVLIKKVNSEDIYEIIVGDRGEIDKCRANYQKAIDDIIPYRDKVYAHIGKMDDLAKSLGIIFNNDGTLHGKSKIARAEKSIVSLRSSFSKAKSLTAEQIKWINGGIKFPKYAALICPFCNAKISTAKKKNIDKFASFAASDYEAIISKEHIFSEVNIDLPKWENKKSREKFVKKIEIYFDLRKELEDIRDYLSIPSNILPADFDIGGFSPIKPSRNFKEYFPDISRALDFFNKKTRDIKTQMGKLKKETNKVIASNVKNINDKISVLGIPYHFIREEINEENKSATYKLCHIEDVQKKDMGVSLSFGEKNLIALLFFLFSKKRKDNLIIDDPASSFDEFRRKVIFDFLFDLNGKSTILVLSHDHVFAKFAIYYRDDKRANRYKERIGKIDFLESYSDFKVQAISKNDFASIEDCVLNTLQNLGTKINYRVALNMRFLFELREKRPKGVYEYLSAIIHEKPYKEIKVLLETGTINEEQIIKSIQEKTQIQYKTLDSDYDSNIDLSSFSLFEKVLHARERLSRTSKKEKIVRDEISNIIHLNIAYAICLNPYRFNYFSKFVYDYLVFKKTL